MADTPSARPVSASFAEIARILTMGNMNGASRLFGGDLLAWMDDVAAVSARRYAQSAVTTASIERLNFLRPAFQNELLSVTGRVIYTGHTSMEVLVKAETEAYDSTRTPVAEGHFILVALDGNGHSRPVPPLLCSTDEERALYAEAQARKEKRGC